MKPIVEFEVKLLTEQDQEINHFKLGSSFDIAVCEDFYHELGFKGSKNKYALLVGPRSAITVWINPLSIPATIKMGKPNNIFVHQDMKGFFPDGERVFLIHFVDFMNFYYNKGHSIKVNRIRRTNLADAIALKIPMKYRRLGYIPGQFFFGIKRQSNQIYKFEMVGFSRESFEISSKRRDIDYLEYLIAPNKFYDYITTLINRKRIIIDKKIERRIIKEANTLRENFSKKILEFFKNKGKLPTRIDLVSNDVGIPLGFENVVLDFLFEKVEIDPRTLSTVERDRLESTARKVLAYTYKKLKQVEKDQWKYNEPLISDIILDMKLSVEDVKKAYAYMNSKNFLIAPAEDTVIAKKAKTVISMIQKNNEIPSIYELISKGLKVHEIKKSFIQIEPLIKNQYAIIDLQIPKIKFPVDEMIGEYREFVTDEQAAAVKVSPQTAVVVQENGEALPLKDQIENAKFERRHDETLKFIGSPDALLKMIRVVVEHEAAFEKITERIAVENDMYYGNLIYAYLGKTKKLVHFSVEVKVTGNVVNQSGEILLRIKSNNAELGDRFFQIFNDRIEDALKKVNHDQLVADSAFLFQTAEHAGKNWVTVEELELRYQFTKERAIRTLEYMDENKQVVKETRASTGTRYYFPTLADKK